ncbi:unnamed protein product [Arabidopsis lyrata]|uniref:Predicted protein n=1 Tax=Arabidopsis lyrata subsp. lyrata TaxID=81972 RepID=D7M088_ARALL|nr:predicted protein [Arabidopsis lyrata subsp. lyrata]CAH8273010.1 unnamed protein product [Arabidopsis lyrata]
MSSLTKNDAPIITLNKLAEVYDFGLTAAEFHAFFDASLWIGGLSPYSLFAFHSQ